MAQTKYKALKQESTTVDNLDDLERSSAVPLITQKHSYLTWFMGIVLSVSLLLNMLHYIPILFRRHEPQYNKTYTSHIEDVPTTYIRDNRTVDDEMWTSDRFNMAYGVVALDDGFVHEHDLPPADRYPWDPSKSVYLLQGYHVMHCVLVFRDLIMNVRDGKPSYWPHDHMVHCLHTLREEIECSADYFPLYIKIPSAEEEDKTTPGVGQVRMCRSWDGLRDFALTHTACWSTHGWHKGDPIIDLYKRCPDGSKPWEDFELE